MKLMAAGVKPVTIANIIRVTLDDLRPVLWPDGKKAAGMTVPRETLERETKRRGWKGWR